MTDDDVTNPLRELLHRRQELTDQIAALPSENEIRTGDWSVAKSRQLQDRRRLVTQLADTKAELQQSTPGVITTGKCRCGARWLFFGEFAEYITAGRERRTTDAFGDGAGDIWDCPFCGATEECGDNTDLRNMINNG